jgi:hypothetical protein
MQIEEYLRDIPLLHSWDGGATWNSGGFNRDHLQCVIDLIQRTFSNARIIETGAGNSTISFMLCSPKELVSICPDQDLFRRIDDFCKKQSIPTAGLVSVLGYSEWELPKIVEKAESLGQSYDFALIDGCHGWPAVFVDFCYINALTRKNSLIMIDDIQLHSVRELTNLLLEQPGYSLEKDLGKALIFRKNSDATKLPGYCAQPYIARNSPSAL